MQLNSNALMEIDQVDKRIINALQNNARLK